jgi:RNA-directed DNA polymerase
MQETLNTKLRWIADRASKDKECVFVQLNRHISVTLLHEAYSRLNKDSAAGLSGETVREYGADLEVNLQNLFCRLRNGTYRIPEIRRVWIDKEDGSKRALGLPETEDKIVQKAISMLLSAVYEQDFYDFSHGFRPKRSAHQALRQLRESCFEKSTRWIIDVDISKFFDTIDHGALMRIIQRRVNDGVLLKYISGWLKTGVVSGGITEYPEEGTPQGGVISPVLANIYLHYVLDEWFVKEVQPRIKGCWLVRYCDDLVIGTEREEDARRILAVLTKRMEKYGLKLHGTKTKLVHFRPPRKEEQTKESRTFTFLGFTHYWGETRQGGWTIKRKIAAKRVKRTMKRLWKWCKANRHLAMKVQYLKLCQKLRGWYQYYALPCNYEIMSAVRARTIRFWHYWLSHRSSKSYIVWERFSRILDKFPLPKPRIIHTTV